MAPPRCCWSVLLLLVAAGVASVLTALVQLPKGDGAAGRGAAWPKELSEEAADNDEGLDWVADQWAAAAMRVPFDECDFGTVRMARTTTFGTLASDSATPARYVWRICPVAQLTDEDVALSSKLLVNMTASLDSEWASIGVGRALAADWRPGGKGILHSIRTKAKDGKAAWAPEVADLAEVTRKRWMSQISLRDVTTASSGAAPFTQSLAMKNILRPHAWSAILWLDREAGAEPKHCAEAPKGRRRKFVAELLAVQPDGSIESWEYSWDGIISAVLLAIWVAARSGDLGGDATFATAAIDCFCASYALALLAWAALKAEMSTSIAGIIRHAATISSVVADVFLVLAWTVVTWQRRSKKALPLPAQLASSLPCALNVVMALALFTSALLPATESQVPPGFFLCAEGMDPLIVPDAGRPWTRLAPPAMLLGPWLALLWRGCQRGRKRIALLLMVLFFAIAPAVSSAMGLLFADYVRRKVQLVVCLCLLRTTGACAMLANLSNSPAPPTDEVYGGDEEELRDAASERAPGDCQRRQPRWQVARMLLAGLAIVVVPAVYAKLKASASAVPKADWQDGRCRPALPKEAVWRPAPGRRTSTDCLSKVVEASWKGRCDEGAAWALPADDVAVHVVFTCNLLQVQGVQAAIASVILSSAAPGDLVIHVVVQRKLLEEFERLLGMSSGCRGLVASRGAHIRLHAVDASMFKKAAATVPKAVKDVRGEIDSLENFARFYMHLILNCSVAIYLDSDVVVQADLGPLRQQLLRSGKTVGFVKREQAVKMSRFLQEPTACNATLLFPRWNQLREKMAYNVGVLAIDLRRWQRFHITELIEKYVQAHNELCEGTLWLGGSQAPLLLAFMDRPPSEVEDFVVFAPTWNAGGLGWQKDLMLDSLADKAVLHWNGDKKPWRPGGFYPDIWKPYCDQFTTVMGHIQSAALTKDAQVEITMQKDCPHLRLLDDWSEKKSCKYGRSFGCNSTPPRENDVGPGQVWVSGCQGLFQVSDKVTVCGMDVGSETCRSGQLPKPSQACGLMILTSFITTRLDWQRLQYATPRFEKIQKLYNSALRVGANITVIYDRLPDTVISNYTCPYFHFEKVDLGDFDARYGVNDVRYFFYFRLLRSHPEWTAVFIVDAFDVVVKRSPCDGFRPKKLYVGAEQEVLRGNMWMEARYNMMGGKYLEWFKTMVDAETRILNCGITGGHRDVMLEFLDHMVRVLSDANLSIRQPGHTQLINLNMAALNFVVYHEYPAAQVMFSGPTRPSAGYVIGDPVHSRYKAYEKHREDVWFVHK